jgi:hypothetical protein
MGWDQKFSEPVELPSRRKLITLRDAALYITKLPKAEHGAEEWLAAMEALLLVAESEGPTMFAPIGVMRALDREKPRAEPAPRQKNGGRSSNPGSEAQICFGVSAR